MVNNRIHNWFIFFFPPIQKILLKANPHVETHDPERSKI